MSQRRNLIVAVAAVGLGTLVLAETGVGTHQMGTGVPGSSDKSQPGVSQSGSAVNDTSGMKSDMQAQMQQPITDQSFVQFAAADNKFMKQSADAAVDQIADPQLKQYAQKVSDDSKSQQEQLKKIAQQKGLTFSDDLNQQQKQALQDLKKKDSTQIGQAFKQTQAYCAQACIDTYRRASQQLTDPDLKSYAQKQLSNMQDDVAQLGVQQPGMAGQTGAQPDTAQPAGAQMPGQQKQPSDQDIPQQTPPDKSKVNP